MNDMTDMTRAELREFLDLRMLREIYDKPPAPMHIPGVCTLRPEAAWKKLVIDTLIPLHRGILEALKSYWHLLTESEQVIVEEYAEAIIRYERDWRKEPLSYPSLPPGFESILQN